MLSSHLLPSNTQFRVAFALDIRVRSTHEKKSLRSDQNQENGYLLKCTALALQLISPASGSKYKQKIVMSSHVMSSTVLVVLIFCPLLFSIHRSFIERIIIKMKKSYTPEILFTQNFYLYLISLRFQISTHHAHTEYMAKCQLQSQSQSDMEMACVSYTPNALHTEIEL